jgi:hypothetical protein
MGQQNTKQESISLPTGKFFKHSYCLSHENKVLKIKNKNIDLSFLVNDYDTQLIMQVFYYKLKHLGYNLSILKHVYTGYRIENILYSFVKEGVPINGDEMINDLNITVEKYEPRLNNIYYHLNNGSILIAGIVLTTEFVNTLFNKTIENRTLSDIILITGYDSENLFIKTTWTNVILTIPNILLKNIREIWNINIKCNFK